MQFGSLLLMKYFANVLMGGGVWDFTCSESPISKDYAKWGHQRT